MQASSLVGARGHDDLGNLGQGALVARCGIAFVMMVGLGLPQVTKLLGDSGTPASQFIPLVFKTLDLATDLIDIRGGDRGPVS